MCRDPLHCNRPDSPRPQGFSTRARRRRGLTGVELISDLTVEPAGYGFAAPPDVPPPFVSPLGALGGLAFAPTSAPGESVEGVAVSVAAGLLATGSDDFVPGSTLFPVLNISVDIVGSVAIGICEISAFVSRRRRRSRRRRSRGRRRRRNWSRTGRGRHERYPTRRLRLDDIYRGRVRRNLINLWTARRWRCGGERGYAGVRRRLGHHSQGLLWC